MDKYLFEVAMRADIKNLTKELENLLTSIKESDGTIGSLNKESLDLSMEMVDKVKQFYRFE